MNRWLVGVDFGQRNDRTAIAAVEVVPTTPTDEMPFPKPFLDVRWLERLPLGMGYPDQCARLAALVDGTAQLKRAEVIIDATGVGVAVSDSLRDVLRRGFIELTITSAGKATVEGRRISVPKRDLVSRLAVAMQARRLRVAPGLGDAPALFDELGSFGVNISESGNDSYGARRGHDDLVLAVSYAVWRAERGGASAAWLEYARRETAQRGVAVRSAARDWRSPR